MAHALLRIGALAIGAFMVLSVLSKTSNVVSKLSDHQEFGVIVFILLPVLAAVFFAALIYKYARDIELVEASPSGGSVLEAGLKLLGIFFLVEGMRSLIGAASVGLAVSSGASIYPTQAYYAGTVGVLYIAASFLLVKKTVWLSSWLNRED